MPGHGERIIQTFDEWFVRINKRVARLERRLAALPNTDVLRSAATRVPAGAIIAWAGPVVPDGWLPLDGGSYPAADYPALAAALGSATATVVVPDVQAPDGLQYLIRT